MTAGEGAMKAYRMEDAGKGGIIELPLPMPSAREVRIKTAYSGICGSDLHAYHGIHIRRRLPLVPGHETSGVVDAVGLGVSPSILGARVTVLPERGCGRCEACRHGWTNVCGSKTLLGTQNWPGAFAEFFCAPIENIIELPADIPLALAVLVEPLAVAVHAVRLAGFDEGDSMLLFGAGAIGSLILAVCGIIGARYSIVCDVRDFSLGVARAQGADVVLNTSGLAASELFEALEGPSVDTVFIAASHHDLINQSFSLVRPHGAVVLVGQFNKPGIIDIDKSRLKEQRILGSFTYLVEDFTEAVELLANFPDAFMPLISAEIPLDEVDATIRTMIAGQIDAIKIIAALGDLH
ncbi:MAG: zinc-dependent alcohol dehydrogenase [Rhizobiaceae bacterium]|jgi:L-iditol 2-dehydrogenase